ncbi:type IV toxin-antitoxin system AbiEi family antitoxin domain-containing protein [Pseudomonas aeruginosa]|uniref:type IV toxin-antitoxin system AbiEi family antitoxin domain-containing protein n=1 Tax=Pseudomonas aeruginosa TaxID=287 RepID=UPI002447F999|nr:type IV toxin-antitoxin system AbiEi family antitoxin domain-containing protein [Pseudomonas aeruginosa]MDG9820345.1 type IV toxin-antitoxin system AbiEi family antitoxin [Pseudomonas aeruginosa]MDG9931487.1 type IV toxin-antitoxin system AbiEi family antitoxin [Pseudomonas aeruginosa]MDH0527588.1 type IV toxin-antitoxin system AbiEi family antitoxin [Pseudomonas aeruginosa]MDH0534811.1 type IV toxin-antitoxin system AbiEi family antitoxin [Pseudomonas aeruginosa]WKA37350.1 type IV toxin-an
MMTLTGTPSGGQTVVCILQKKITQNDLFTEVSNSWSLAEVYKTDNLSTMSAQNSGKLNRLLVELGDTRLVSSRWLRAHDYSNSLVARYVGSGWLVSPARGVYMRAGGRLQWDGVVRSLQVGEGTPLHVGGRFALALQGHEHYLRLGNAGTITLYGPVPPPGWVGKLSMEQRFEYQGKGPFDLPAVSFTAEVFETALSKVGLALHSAAPGVDALVCSTPERAMLELCDGVSNAAEVYEADALMQAMTTLRPQRVGLLLRHCRSIKAKRLFLALADRHQHAWLAHVSMDGVDLGRGKRALVPGGRLHPTYQITLPGDLDEHLA